MKEINEFKTYEEYKNYIKRVGQNIHYELIKDNWTIEYRIYDVDGRIIRGIEHNPDKYHERIDAFDKYMEMEIRKDNTCFKSTVKKSTEDAHDKRFMIMLGLYRAWHKKKKYEEMMENLLTDSSGTVWNDYNLTFNIESKND